jgi:NADH:ubiquinone oxidoreductase subunit F (NADH-binding)
MGEWLARDLFRHWIGFFMTESCGQCTPCREGTYRLFELVNVKNPDWKLFSDILNDLSESSLCGLGLSVPTAIRSYIKNVLLDKNLKIKDADKEQISKYF